MGCGDSKEKAPKEAPKAEPKKPKTPPPKPREVKPPTPKEPTPIPTPIPTPTPQEDARPAPNAAEQRTREVKDNHQGLGECAVKNGEVTPIYPPEGLVYRIDEDGVIYYYNDTVSNEGVVEHIFAPGSEVFPGPRTYLETLGDGSIRATCTVYPLETIEFASGKFTGNQFKVALEPVSEEYLAAEAEEANRIVDEELQRVENVAGESDPEETLKKCVENNIMFVDTEFPPKHSILSRRKIDTRQLPKIAFMRPTQYLRDELKDQSNDIIGPIAPSSIHRGYLGDCWVSCAAAILTNDESIIKQIFSRGTPSEKNVGAYRVLMQKNGWFQNVIVDNFLPVVARRPVFASIVDDPRELWMSLFQKAYAKVNGSYAAITGGDAVHVIQDFTGAPFYRFDDEWEQAVHNGDKAREMFDLMENSSSHVIVINTPMSGSKSWLGAQHTSAKETKKKYDELGLRQGYTYLVDRIVRVGPTALFHVLNPWGLNTIWKGDWGEGSSKWKEHVDIKLRCKPSWNKDGEFWMQWEDIMHYFDGGAVIFKNNSFYNYSIRGLFQGLKPTAALEVRAAERVEVTLTLTQKDKRGVPIYEPDAVLGAILLSVSEETNDGRQRVVQNTSINPMCPTTSDTYSFVVDRSVSMKYTFEPNGKSYFIVPRLHSGAMEEDDHQREYVLTISAPQSLESRLNVEVKHIPSHCRAFRNLVQFDMDGINNVEAEQQITENYESRTRVSSVLIAGSD